MYVLWWVCVICAVPCILSQCGFVVAWGVDVGQTASVAAHCFPVYLDVW
jgi:hypothetical protein